MFGQAVRWQWYQCNRGWAFLLLLVLLFSYDIQLTSSQTSRDYPPAALTSASFTVTGQVYGNGLYVTSSSTTLNAFFAFNAFDKNTATFCHSETQYTGSTGVYIGTESTLMDGVARVGEWFQIQLPNRIIVTAIVLTPRQDNGLYDVRSPRGWFLGGSNDGVTWNAVGQETGFTSWTLATRTISLSSSGSYQYYRLVTFRVGNAQSSNQNSVQFGEIVLRGFEPPTGQPTGVPSMQPSNQPSSQPSTQPTTQPSSQPTRQPTTQPTVVKVS